MLIHPGLIFILLGVIGLITRKPIHKYISVPVAGIVFSISCFVDYQTALSFNFLGYKLALINIDSLSKVFLIIFSLMTFVGLIFAINQKNKKETSWALIYAGAGIVAVLAYDLLTFFVFCELMAIGSTFLIITSKTESSKKAGMRYAIVHFLAGTLILFGIAGHIAEAGTVVFNKLNIDDLYVQLIFLGFLINAGCFPFSSWIPDSYPEASFSGSVFLSAFTTKTAVYSLLRGFPGTEVLIYLGLIMIFYGIIYALLENDMRRILSFSIVNQVGFMLVGAGIGTEMAINGASSHAFAHIIYKALLLMSAGSVLYMTGKSKCSELGGLFQTMPITMICGTIGAFAISAFPLTSGFVTKSMISYAAADEHLFYVWMLLVAASAGVFLHAGIKFPWFVFFQKDSGLRPPDPPLNMRIAMYLLSGLCILIGCFPAVIYSILPYPVKYDPYTFSHVLFQLQLLTFAGFAFFIMLPWLKRTETISLDVDWLYRTGIPKFSYFLKQCTNVLKHKFTTSYNQRLGGVWDKIISNLDKIANLSMEMPTRVMIVSLKLVIVSFLAVLYFSIF